MVNLLRKYGICGDKETEKWFAVLTSCSAPTYFDCVYDDAGNCYIDVGMWKNSPIDVLNAGLIKSGWSNYKILNWLMRGAPKKITEVTSRLEEMFDAKGNETGSKMVKQTITKGAK